MDAEEMTDWEALYTHIEPMPEERSDLRMAIGVAHGYAPHMKRGVSMPQPKEFMPRFGEDAKRPKQSMENMKAQWKRAVALFGRGKQGKK